ncbi:2-oxoglutarate and iron-dependent oxygenase JMJD4-like [Ptychodera flava]|uniref:2-oxoglutarate and iron-dependent oxygenase JMJD4-like n=1 Tax=Ptychodera flava TaxID=63121 RepID=UPI00396A0F97
MMSFYIKTFTMVAVAIVMNFPTYHAGDPEGHLLPLGSHQPPEGDIEEIDTIPSPMEFYDRYIKPSKPVIFKGAAKMSPGFYLWNDDYLRNHHGDAVVRVDYGKKENRARSADPMPLREFLEIYNSSDRYLVDTLPEPMWNEYVLLPCITCGGFTRGLQDAVLWFSSGGTKSFLHMDTVDNINCMMSGTKEWFFVDIRESHHIDFDHKEGDYSAVNVDKVDMYAYPGLRDVPWWCATLNTGDCMYVPYGWGHQVTSLSRNIAVNIWWTPLSAFNETDCQDALKSNRQGLPLDGFQFTPAEQFRFMIMKLIENNGGRVSSEQIKKLLVSEHEGTSVMDNEVFAKFDVDGDGFLSTADLTQVPVAVFHDELADFEPGAINIIGQSRKKQEDVENLLASLDHQQPPDIEEFLLREDKTKEDIVDFLKQKEGSLPGQVVEFLKAIILTPESLHEEL